MERTFVMVKPNGVARGLVGEVVTRFERRGFVLRGMKALHIDRALAERHYASTSASRSSSRWPPSSPPGRSWPWCGKAATP